MKGIKLFLPLVLSIALVLPIKPIKSFNHDSDKNLVINYEFTDKISYFF